MQGIFFGPSMPPLEGFICVPLEVGYHVKVMENRLQIASCFPTATSDARAIRSLSCAPCHFALFFFFRQRIQEKG